MTDRRETGGFHMRKHTEAGTIEEASFRLYNIKKGLLI